MNIKFYFMLFIIYSFMGWIMETIDVLITRKKCMNRGFLLGPICPIYGVGCLLIIILLQRYIDQPLILFVMSILVCSVLEYLTSYIMEKLFKVRWWDYSHKKYNINGRICLETMIPFGILGTLIMYFVNPFFTNILNFFPSGLLNGLFYIIITIFIIDLIISVKVVIDVKGVTSTIIKDNTEEMNKKVKDVILGKLKTLKEGKETLDEKLRKKLLEKSYFTKRFINAFPKFKVIEKIKNIKKEDD